MRKLFMAALFIACTAPFTFAQTASGDRPAVMVSEFCGLTVIGTSLALEGTHGCDR